MTATEQIVTIAVMALGVMTTRFISFVLFASEKRTPRFVQYLSRYLPSAVFGMLVVYCLKDVEFTSGHYAIPELLGIAVCVLLHLWRKNMLLTIAGGTVFYMWLINTHGESGWISYNCCLIKAVFSKICCIFTFQ